MIDLIKWELESPKEGCLTLKDPQGIIKYFEKVRELHKQGNGFCVDLDIVYPLVYARKDNAVAVLKRNFKEGIDYQVSRRAQENSKSGRPTENYHLTVACMEYLVAREVDEVFEVYRRIFHSTIDEVEKPKSSLDMFELALKVAKEQEEKITKLKEMADGAANMLQQHQEMLDSLNSSKSLPENYPIPLRTFCDENNILVGKENSRERKSIGKKVANYCRKAKIKGFIDNAPNPCFYPKSVLKDFFRHYIKSHKSMPVEGQIIVSEHSLHPLEYFAIVQYASKYNIRIKNENSLGMAARKFCMEAQPQIPMNVGGKWKSPSGLFVNTYREDVLREIFTRRGYVH